MKTPVHYDSLRQSVALAFMDEGAVLTRDSIHPRVITRPNGERGFILQLHEKNPDAPLSPYFFNLRTPNNPNPGPLTPEIVQMGADCLHSLAFRENLQYARVAGVPNAGDPFAQEFAGIPFVTQRLQLVKGKKDGKRAITGIDGEIPQKGTRVLLLDDLITTAGSKVLAIKVLEDHGLVVEDVLVLIDREQGGHEELRKAGYRLHSVFTMTELFGIYRDSGKISPELYADSMTYKAANG